MTSNRCSAALLQLFGNSSVSVVTCVSAGSRSLSSFSSLHFSRLQLGHLPFLKPQWGQRSEEGGGQRSVGCAAVAGLSSPARTSYNDVFIFNLWPWADEGESCSFTLIYKYGNKKQMSLLHPGGLVINRYCIDNTGPNTSLKHVILYLQDSLKPRSVQFLSVWTSENTNKY